MKACKLLSVVVAAASTLFVALSARAEFTCELTFPQAPSTALANFPVLVRLAEDAPTGFSYADCPTGSCIWFTDASDNAIPCDVDTWDDEGESLVWVSVPSLSDAATIKMHWDAAGAPAGQPASSQVWSLADYVGVWHMNEILEDNGLHYTPDASASGWNAYKANEADGYPVTISDAGIAASVPPTGHAMVNQLNDATRTTGGFLVPANRTEGTTIGPFTISFFEATVNTGNDRVVGFGTSYSDIGCMTAAASETYIMFGGNNYKKFAYADGLAQNAWRHVAGVFNSTPVGYAGGVSKSFTQSSGSFNSFMMTLSKGIGLGTFTGHTETFTGNLDEIRIRNVASTGEWVAEEYKTVTTANYVTFGEVETGVEVLRLGPAAVLDVTATSALVTGELRTLGEGATSADIYLIYTDGTTTNAVSVGSTNAAPAALSFTLGNLAALTTYTCWFTATNSLSAGADSKTATFRTKYIPTGSGIFECELSFPSAPATPLVNFPVLVRISEAGLEGFFYEQYPTAANLWFTDASGEALPFEVDEWNTAGESLVWVSVPSFSSATKITMHWSSDADSVEDSPDAREVWTRAGYNAVWHFSGSNAESVNGLNASVTKGSPTYDGNASCPGPLGKTLWLANNSTLGYAVDPAWTTLGENASLTISCLARPVTASLGKYARMVCCQTSWEVKHGYTFAVHDPINKITLGSSDSSELELNADAWSGWPASDWVHWAARYDNTAGAIFKDGQTAKSGTIKTLITPQGMLCLGANGDGNQRYWVGGLDEIRIRAAASTAEWVAAEYATIASRDFVAFGDVEEAPAATTLEFGAVSVTSVSTMGATLKARLKGLGEGATSADVRVVVSGFGQTRSYPVTNGVEGAASIVATLEGLNPGTEWTAWFVATNNAAPAVGTNSAAVVFSTVSDAGFVGTPGLYQAASSGQSNAADAAHNWNIAADGVVTPGPQAMRNANSWTSADGTTFQWANGAAFAYTGYMYMESGKDYYFSAAIDDAGYAWVNDGSGDWYAARQSPQFNTTWKADGPYNVSESGYHQVVFSAWNSSGGAGATGNKMLRYVAVAPGASAPAQASDDWLATVDPGDGSLFLPTPPVRAVSVVSARRDGTVVSAKVALEAAVAGETSELLYVYGATHGGNNPTNWTGRGLVDSSPATSAVTNDYLVGIASDTRYIRFYTKSGDSVNWSATIAVEWAEETTLAETFVFTGEISASDVATTNATILGHLAALGDGATSADVWLVLSGFGQTKTYAVTHLAEGAELSAALADLIPGTEWTVHFTATNNLGAGADSPAFTFSTLSDSGAAGVSGFYQVRITSQNTLRSAATLDIVGDADGTLVAPAPHGLRAAVGVPWYSTDGTQWTYGGNTGYGYSGYMFMEGGKDYYFSAGIDDEGHVWVDNGAANWDAAHTASQFPSSWAAAGPFAIAEDGWYHVVFAGWNGGGNGGANGTYGPLRYIAVESGASAPVKESTAWIDAVDPGDGSLFLSDKPSRKVAVLSADRDGDLLSAKVALGAAFAGETSVLRYVYGASNGGNDPADWEGGSLVSAALPPGAVTNDYLVGIAANTRFVRFYATDGISLTWSDTIALEWSGETEVVEKFIFLGDPEASSISGDSATLSAVLNVPEAASAQAWFVLAGGGETLLIPAGTITARTNLAVAVTGLASETTYTFYATATNNVATPVGADSAVATFTTGPAASAWRPDRAVVTQDGKLFTIQVEVPYAGIGTTTLYLMTGSNWNNENTVSDSAVVTGPGVYSLAVDFSDKPWGHAFYYSLKLVNGTAENAITNWPNATSGQPFYNKSATIQDNSTYTWVGGATGVWNDTNNWTRTATGSCAATGYVGYPVIGSTVIFAAAADTDPVTVTIPATAGTSVSGGTPCWGAGTINLNGMLAPITFTSAVAGNDNRLQFGGLNADNANLDVTFDGCYFNTGSAPHIGANAAVDGRNAVLTFKNGARGYFSQLWVDKPAAKVRVLSGALLEDGYFLSGVNLTGEENRPVLEVEDAEYVNKANSFAFDWNNGNNTNGPLVRLLGTHPRVSSINFNMTRTAGGTTAIFEFVVPAGGYAYAPVHFLSDSAFNSTLRSPITLKVSPDSPALKAGFATTTRLVDAKLVDVADEAAAVVFDLPSGVTASRHTNEDGNEEGYDVSIPAGAGPALSNVAIVSCKDDSFTIGGDVLIATANELATITSYVAEGEGDFVASGSKTSGGGTFKVKASGLVSGANYRWYVEAITPSGSFRTAEQALTFHPGEAEVSAASVASIKVDGEKVYVFTNSLEVGSITFSRGGLVEVLVVGGGGAGGNAMGGGGGAGAFLYRRDFIPAGTYDVTVGKGGSNTDNNQSNYAIPAESSSIGDIFVAPGGGAGGHWGSIGLNQGGSAGGNSGNANVPAVGTYPLGRDGGSQTTGGKYLGSGGGGAGGAGHDARTWGDVYYGGRGGDGVACSITGEEKIYAAGGGGGAGTAGYIPGSAGLGGVRGCGMADEEIFDAPANTGSGGGGGNWQNNAYRMGGSGGSGIVVIRVKKFNKIGFSIIVR